MIHGYARHGFGEEALTVFELMKTTGTRPDDATMVWFDLLFWHV
jgi:pentatricopeptide repeat protein